MFPDRNETTRICSKASSIDRLARGDRDTALVNHTTSSNAVGRGDSRLQVLSEEELGLPPMNLRATVEPTAEKRAPASGALCEITVALVAEVVQMPCAISKIDR